MTTYRVGNRNPRNIYRLGPDGEQHVGCMFDPADGPLVVESLNAMQRPRLHVELNPNISAEDFEELLTRFQGTIVSTPARVVTPYEPKPYEPVCANAEQSPHRFGSRPNMCATCSEASRPADSCTCVYRPNGGPDPACPVHQGRRARGPKPPALGPGCICDGSGRTCPRHGAVI